MGSCYSADHDVEGHIQTDIPCNIEEPQQKFRLGTVSNKIRLKSNKIQLNRLRDTYHNYSNLIRP